MDDDLIQLGLLDEDDILLDEAALALAMPDHADADIPACTALLEAIEARLRVAGEDARTPAERADALAAVLGRAFDFAGDADSYDDPANADLIRVLDRRRGLPVSLAILWVAAARRLDWSAEVLDVPGHVLVLVGGEADAVIVDPFARGARAGAERLSALVRQAPNHAGTLVAAMPNRAVLVRLLQNQASRAEQVGQGGRALELYRRMTAVAPAIGHGWWQRARLELADGDVPAARGSLAAILEITRQPALRGRVVEMLGAIGPN